MPEGDTIHRTAAALRAALVGARLRRVDLPRVPGPPLNVGASVRSVTARGKHLLLATDDGLVLHTHLRMTGSWHLYAPGHRWRKPDRFARAVLAVPGATAVCFSAPIVEVLDDEAVRRHPTLRRLGPDLTDPHTPRDTVLDDAVARARNLDVAARTAGELLLDQRVACGIGNVYRSEVLFVHGLDPWLPAELLDEPTLRGLYDTAASLLQANLSTGSRTTVQGSEPGALWVYGRDNAPCRRCAQPIERVLLGDPARVVYSCRSCQPPAQASRLPRPDGAS